MSATEFYDKSKRQIFTGDIVQYKLNNLRDGGVKGVIVRLKRGYKMCWLKGDEYQIENGLMLRKSYEPYITILNTQNRE
jgi:hypothetical protein